MAIFFRIIAVLVLLAGAYTTYAEYADYNAGLISLAGLLSKFVLAIGLAAFLWFMANRAARSGSHSDSGAGDS